MQSFNQHFQIMYHLDWGSVFNVRQCRIAWFDTSAVTTDGTVPGMETEEPFLYGHFVLKKPRRLWGALQFWWSHFVGRCLGVWKNVFQQSILSGVGDEFHQSGGLPWLGISDLEAERLPETLFHHPLLGIFSIPLREVIRDSWGPNFVCGLWLDVT